jgi:alkanesulfonate monooxygenase SsuD/methylene tetrahydromethanopterin reductase-like flavin-dependent oxidoreductase (luciferase family)
MAELAAEAEQAGWDGVFLEDYTGYQGKPGVHTYDPWVTMAAMAVATSRLRLATTVTPLPRRRPWKLASEAATLDHLSGGRVILGVARGTSMIRASEPPESRSARPPAHGSSTKGWRSPPGCGRGSRSHSTGGTTRSAS